MFLGELLLESIETFLQSLLCNFCLLAKVIRRRPLYILLGTLCTTTGMLTSPIRRTPSIARQTFHKASLRRLDLFTTVPLTSNVLSQTLGFNLPSLLDIFLFSARLLSGTLRAIELGYIFVRLFSLPFFRRGGIICTSKSLLIWAGFLSDMYGGAGEEVAADERSIGEELPSF